MRGSALRSGGYVVAIGLSLLSAPLLIRHLGVAEYGVYVTITALVTVAAGVSDIGITSVGVREWAIRPAVERRALLANLWGARLTLTLAGCLAAFAFALLAGYGSVRLAGTAVACVGLIATASYEALAVPLQAELRQGRVAAAELTRQAVQVGLILLLVAAGAGLVPFLATAIPAGLCAAAVVVSASSQGLVRPAVHPRAWWDLLRDTLPFAAASAIGVVYLRTTVIITSLVAGALQTGYFGAAFRVTEVLMGVPVLLVGALFPILARAAATDRERLRSGLRQTFEGALAAGTLTAVCMIGAAPLAIRILVGAKATPAVEALSILSVGLGFSFLGATSQFALLALREHRSILIVNAGALVANVALTLLLATSGGARGAAVSLAVCETLVALSSTALLARVSPGFAPARGTSMRIALVVVLGGGTAAALSGTGPVLQAVGTAVVSLGAASILRTLPSELWALLPLRRLLAPRKA